MGLQRLNRLLKNSICAVVAAPIDRDRWNLAKAIAAKNGGDVDTIYSQLLYVMTKGGNADFQPGNPQVGFIDLSFLDPKHDYRSGNVHLHYEDGLVHLDSFNPFSNFPIGALGHLIVDLGMGNINSSVPMN